MINSQFNMIYSHPYELFFFVHLIMLFLYMFRGEFLPIKNKRLLQISHFECGNVRSYYFYA